MSPAAIAKLTDLIAGAPSPWCDLRIMDMATTRIQADRCVEIARRARSGQGHHVQGRTRLVRALTPTFLASTQNRLAENIHLDGASAPSRRRGIVTSATSISPRTPPLAPERRDAPDVRRAAGPAYSGHDPRASCSTIPIMVIRTASAQLRSGGYNLRRKHCTIRGDLRGTVCYAFSRPTRSPSNHAPRWEGVATVKLMGNLELKRLCPASCRSSRQRALRRTQDSTRRTRTSS